MTLTIIAAVGADHAIGRAGDLAFYISADLKHFKELTIGHPIIMGRKTFESMPKGALPGRRNIVITRQDGYSAPDIEVADSLESALKLVSNVDEAFIIGGASIYAEALPYADCLQLTEIKATAPDADTFFPEIDASQWTITAETPTAQDPKSGLSYSFRCLTRAKQVNYK